MTCMYLSHLFSVMDCEMITNANDTCCRNRRQNTGVRFCHAVWCILESDRTVFYFATESGSCMIKILSSDWSVFNVGLLVLFLFNLEVLVSW